MEPENFEKELFATDSEVFEKQADPTWFKYALEQYRTYIGIFNSTADRSHKSNEFFLGLNAAIIGILGYAETKELRHSNILFLLIPLIGISICYSWFRIIQTYSKLNRAKFKIIHMVEQKLPLSLFKTEWSILGEGKDRRKYYHFSKIEKNIPLTFIIFYLLILVINMPWSALLDLFTKGL